MNSGVAEGSSFCIALCSGSIDALDPERGLQRDAHLRAETRTLALICCDRAKQHNLEMAQEFVSQMLGSTRSTVSIAAAHLKAKGLIDYRHGAIQILNFKGLETESCECYWVVREHLENFADFDNEFTV